MECNYIHLRGQIESMQRLLKEIEAKNTEAFKLWIGKARQMRRTVEDLQTDFDLSLQKRCLSIFPHYWHRYQICRRVSKCNSDIEDLRKYVEFESFDGPPLRKQYYVRAESIENSKYHIENWLTEEGRIIGVWGRAGVGKTTLLTLIYNSQNMRKYFNGKIFWVKLSSSPPTIDIETLRESIRREIGLPESFNARELKNHLCTILGSNRFLLIVDDIQDGLNFPELIRMLKKIGLPLSSNGKYKLVFSSPGGQVVADVNAKAVEMKVVTAAIATLTIEVKPLSKEESCKLHQNAQTESIRDNILLAESKIAQASADDNSSQWHLLLWLCFCFLVKWYGCVAVIRFIIVVTDIFWLGVLAFICLYWLLRLPVRLKHISNKLAWSLKVEESFSASVNLDKKGKGLALPEQDDSSTSHKIKDDALAAEHVGCSTSYERKWKAEPQDVGCSFKLPSTEKLKGLEL